LSWEQPERFATEIRGVPMADGVASLSLGTPVELELIFEVEG
jgi:hypothetical protein